MMTNCNDPRKRCGQIIPSNCVPYEGVKPDFVDANDYPCDVNVTDIVQLSTDKIDDILEDTDLTGLNNRCLAFDPDIVTQKELEQIEIDKICALDAQVSTLQNDWNTLDIGSQLVAINLGILAPINNPCSIAPNTYTLYYVLTTLLANLGSGGSGGGSTTLANLTDVLLSSLSVNDFIKWNGTAWINRSPANVKSDLSINNVDNTSDINKPVSTPQAASIATKQNTLVSGTNIKTINGASLLGSGDVSITSSSIFSTDVEVTDFTKGIILKTSDGTRARITLTKDIVGDLELTITAL